MAGSLMRHAAGWPRERSRASLSALAACLALLVLGAWLAPSGEAARSASAAPATPLGGVNITGVSGGLPLALADREVQRAQALHAKLVRVEVQWSALEPEAPERVDPAPLAFLDRVVSDAARGGMGVIATVDSTPCWASSAPASLLRACASGQRSRANAWPPAQPSAYAAFVAYLASRYGSKLAAIEVWNEPDQANQDYFAGPDKPQRYASILRAAYPAIKQANSAIRVLAGSLVGSNGVFLRALYQAGIKGYYDGLAVHFYNLTLASLRAIHETQLANGDATPLWLDEFGWSSCWPRQRIQQEQACVTAGVQARDIANIYRSLAHTPYVAAAVLYKLRDSAHEDFGVIDAAGARKPSFAALADVLRSPWGSPSGVRLTLSAHRGEVTASGEGPVGDYMQLEASLGGRLRYRALFTLDRFNRYSIPLPRALGMKGLTVRVFQYWAGRARGVQRSI